MKRSGVGVGAWLGSVRGAGWRVVLAGGTALLLAMLAPWSSAEVPFARRAAQFLLCALAWEAAIAATTHGVRRRWGAWVDTPAGLGLCCFLASVPATGFTVVVFTLLGDRTGPLPTFYVKSVLLGLVIAFARRGLSGRRDLPRTADPPAGTPHDPADDPPEPAPASLGREAGFVLRHAPALAGSRLLALQAEDHYLRIHTSSGTALVLLRLRDAVAELEGTGWQPHRSFWLAHGAGGQAVRRGQAWQVVLDGGLQVPVSKPCVPAMREAGYASAS